MKRENVWWTASTAAGAGAAVTARLGFWGWAIYLGLVALNTLVLAWAEPALDRRRRRRKVTAIRPARNAHD